MKPSQMDPFVENIYLRELARECANAFSAVERINALLDGDDMARNEIFRELGDLLQHAAAASRLLWSPERKARAKARSEHLRSAINVAFEHGLHNRDLRNHLEHYDDRLDQWVADSQNRIMIGALIGPRSVVTGDLVKDNEIMRHYDPETKHFVFRGERFDIQRLIDDLSDIYKRTQARLAELQQYPA